MSEDMTTDKALRILHEAKGDLMSLTTQAVSKGRIDLANEAMSAYNHLEGLYQVYTDNCLGDVDMSEIDNIEAWAISQGMLVRIEDWIKAGMPDKHKE